jgi:coronin-1B/1C/6
MTFHPTAEHVLATGSADQLVKILDVEKGAAQFSVDHPGGVIYDVCWSYNGDQLLSACKDKMLRIIDPRSGSFAGEVEAHEGTKTTKLCYLGKEEKVLSAGFTKQSKRQFKIWDPRKLAKEIASADIDQAAGVLMPFYDEDTNLLYLTGKGDGNVRYYEIVNDEPWQFFISEYRSTTPCRGMAMLPKRICDVMKCEVTRMLKLGTNNVEPLPFIIPRKSDLFQADLFPPARAGKPAMNATEFFGGKSAKPTLMELDPKKRPAGEAGGAAAAKTFSAPKSVAQLNAELDAAHKRIAELEAKLKANNIAA